MANLCEHGLKKIECYVCVSPKTGVPSAADELIERITIHLRDLAPHVKNRLTPRLVCVWAENNIDSLSDFFGTWARNCGAPKSVFIGHTVKMLINI
jgi:hypothetical protein